MTGHQSYGCQSCSGNWDFFNLFSSHLHPTNPFWYFFFVFAFLSFCRFFLSFILLWCSPKNFLDDVLIFSCSADHVRTVLIRTRLDFLSKFYRSDLYPVPSLSYSSRQRNEFPWYSVYILYRAINVRTRPAGTRSSLYYFCPPPVCLSSCKVQVVRPYLLLYYTIPLLLIGYYDTSLRHPHQLSKLAEASITSKHRPTTATASNCNYCIRLNPTSRDIVAFSKDDGPSRKEKKMRSKFQLPATWFILFLINTVGGSTSSSSDEDGVVYVRPNEYKKWRTNPKARQHEHVHDCDGWDGCFITVVLVYQNN